VDHRRDHWDLWRRGPATAADPVGIILIVVALLVGPGGVSIFT
jgi:hypothetical protein